MPPDPDQIPYVKVVKRLTNIDEIHDVPVIGGLYGTANAIVDYWESDCNPDWHVYVETLFPVLGQAVITLVSFGLDDVLRGYFRPAGGRGFGGLGRSWKRGKRLSKAEKALGKLEKGIPELGEMVGTKLPGAELVKARRVTAAEKFLWQVDGIAQRGLWYWMVADILEDSTVAWTSALMQSQACIGIEVGGVIRTNSVADAIGHQAFALVDVGTIVKQWGNVTSTDRTFRCPAGFFGNISFSAHWVPELPGTPPGSLVIAGGGVVQGSRPPVLDPETGHMNASVDFAIRGGVTYTIGLANYGGWSSWRDLEVVFIVRGGQLP